MLFEDCSHTPLNMCWLIIYMKDIHSKFLFFREVQRNSELKQYIEDQQIQEQNISHTKLEEGRIKEVKERQGMVVE